MKKYQIYQLDLHNQDVVNERKAFMSWADIINHSTGFNFQQYTKVYEGTLPEMADKEDWQYLEDLFEKFNLNHPDDYHGRSMSTSDVVILDNTIYYCDDCGWTEVSNPKEIAIAKANKILHSYGYHTGNVVDYDEVVEMLTDVILQQNQQ